jgi:hypothetical protein
VPLPGHGIGLPPTVRYRGRCSGGVPSLLPPVSGARSGTPSLASHPGPGVLHMSVAQLLFLMAPARLRPAGLPPIRGRQAERSKGCTYRDGPQRVQRLPIAASRISRRRACRQWQLLSHVRDGRGAGRAAGDRHAVSRAPSSTLSSNQGLQWSLGASRQGKGRGGSCCCEPARSCPWDVVPMSGFVLRCRLLGHRFRFTADGATLRWHPSDGVEQAAPGGISRQRLRTVMPLPSTARTERTLDGARRWGCSHFAYFAWAGSAAPDPASGRCARRVSTATALPGRGAQLRSNRTPSRLLFSPRRGLVRE